MRPRRMHLPDFIYRFPEVIGNLCKLLIFNPHDPRCSRTAVSPCQTSSKSSVIHLTRSCMWHRTGSFKAALAAVKVHQPERKWTSVIGRPATTEEEEHLELARGTTVLVVGSVYADGSGEPVFASKTSFAADRVELQVDMD